MEGMDLWTSMFSSDFDEGDIVDGEGENFNKANNTHTDEYFEEDENEPDIDDADEAYEESEGDEKRNHVRKKQKGLEPDDDTIFDFELEPINIAEQDAELGRRGNITKSPSMPVATSARGTHRHSLPATFGSSVMPRGAGVGASSSGPTTSQINATDQNGLHINYELGVVYICPACGAEFRQQDLWKRHLNDIHQYNTRKGLNFVAIDKLYHRCLECNKRIAMHSRENLLKHKFTHLPFRCTKCYLCKREYKYRQDLMVHLRMVHCDEVGAMMRDSDGTAGRKTRVREPRTERQFPRASSVDNNELDTMEVKENQAAETEPSPCADAVTLDDEPLLKRKRGKPNPAADICEDYIHYMCPDCNTDCDNHAQWSQHIEFVHDYVSRRGLNFRCVDMQMQCLECEQIVIPNTIKRLRAHKFSHLSQPEWMRCKLCYKGYSVHYELVRHLLKQHNLETLLPDDEEMDESIITAGATATATDNAIDDADDETVANGYNEDSSNWDDAPRRGGRVSSDHMFEPHIDYLCPQCGREFIEKKHWRTHVVQVHGMNDLAKLNFEIVNDRQLKCTECDKIITNAYGIQNAQQHHITHLPFKAYARCRKCHKSYTDRKGLVKHLATYHRVGYEPRKSGSGGVSTKMQTPRKQLVTVGNDTYEITYLDEEDPCVINEENDFGEQMQGDDDDLIISTNSRELAAPSALSSNPNRYKCVDCGSLFPTQIALKTHISEEHDFMDSQYSAKRFDKAEPTDDKVVPKAVASVSPPTTSGSSSSKQAVPLNSSGSSTVEQNYIFLCPSCGTSYNTQFEWRRHINEAHNFDKRLYLNMRQLDKHRYQCTQCKDIVCNSKLKGLQDHHFRHLPFRLYLKCLVCGTCYNHKPNIAAHLRTRHNIFEKDTRWRELPAKPTKFTQYSAANKNMEKRERSASPLPSSSGVVPGRTLKPQPGILATRPPGLNTLEDSISYHNAVDLDFITYYCPKCNQNFDSHAFWRKHIVEHHNYNSRQGLNFRQIDNHHYLCLECYKRVTVTHTKGAIGQLQSHKFRHLPYRSFKCLTCGGEFVRKQMFFKHLNRDTNRCDNKPLAGQDNEDDVVMEQPNAGGEVAATDDVAAYRLMCPQCGDIFITSSRTAWSEHVNVYHGLGKLEALHLRKFGEDLYRCIDCDEQLQTKQLRVLQHHRFKHMPHGDYVRCQLCEDRDDGGKNHLKAAAGLQSMRELRKHLREQHPELAENDDVMQSLHEEEDKEVVDASLPNSECGKARYVPLPPHLLDDEGADDGMEFEDQYLLG